MKYSSQHFFRILILLFSAGLAQACVSNGVTISEQQVAGLSSSSLSERTPMLLSKVSENNFSTTVEKIQAAIDSRGFKTFAVIDHAAGAASIDKELRPTTLFIFGNPNGGTPLMQSVQTMGIELPLRMLAYENADGQIVLSWFDMSHIFEEYDVSGRDAILSKITGALSAIAEEASTN